MSERFTRREINRSLIAGAVMLATRSPLPRTRATIALFDFAIAGGWFHGLDGARADLATGQKFLLRADAANRHDVHAVGVHLEDGTHLGYIPRIANQPVAELLRIGARIDATIVGRLDVRRAADLPADLVFTGFAAGDPRIRLVLV